MLPRNSFPGRPYDRIGLVVFSGETFTMSADNRSCESLINLMREMKAVWIEDGTAIGMGLANAVTG